MIKNKFNILPIILFILTISIIAFAGSPLPDYKPQFFDANGDPLTSGSLKLCNPGTTNVKTIYTNSGLTVPKANPVNLDSSGRAEVWLNGTYDVYLYDGQNATGNLIYTLYNISSISAASSPFTPNYVDASEYGDLTATITTLGLSLPYEVWVTDQQTLTSDTVIPDNITLHVLGGGIIVADGYKLTFDGPLSASPMQHIFTGFTADEYGVVFSYPLTVYPEWWGAVADASTDCVGAINSSIACMTSGGISSLGAGTYVITDTIDGAPKVHLAGSGWSTVIYQSTADTNGIDSGTGSDDFSVSDLYMYGHSKNDSTSGYGIYIRDSDRCRITNVKAQNWGKDGIYLGPDYSDDGVVTGCFSSYNGRHGICIGGGLRNIVSNNTCSSNGLYGIDVEGSGVGASIIQHNVCNSNVNGITTASDTLGSHLVEGNYCNGNSEHGIQSSGIYTRVIANHCEANSENGIYGGGKNYQTYYGNTCIDNTWSGIHLTTIAYTTVNGNISNKNDRHGFHLDHASYCTISNNESIDNNYDETGTYEGFYCGDLDYSVIDHNIARETASNRQDRGFYIPSGSDHNQFSHNYVSGNDTASIVNLGSGNSFYNNIGYVTTASGSDTIASGLTAVYVTHGLSITPAAKNIIIQTYVSGANDQGNVYIDDVGSNTFRVRCQNDPGTGGYQFYWNVVAP